MDTLLLKKSEIAELLSMKDVIAAVKDGYMDYSLGTTLQPDIVSFELPEHNGETDIKSGYSQKTGMIAVKVASGYWDNEEKHQLPTMLASMTLFDGKTGYPLCFMDASLITGYRTGASGAIAASLLADPSTTEVTVMGTGTQAYMQVLALQEVFRLKTVYLWGIDQEQAQTYKLKAERNMNLTVKVCATPEEAVTSTRLIITTTPATQFYVKKEWVQPGSHINAVGADMAGKNEIDPALFPGSLILADCIPQCVSRGETRNPLIQNLIAKQDIYGEIGELLLSRKPAKKDKDMISIFDTTGMSIQDNVTAAALYRKALDKNIGTKIQMF